jgi:hypothetical protein
LSFSLRMGFKGCSSIIFWYFVHLLCSFDFQKHGANFYLKYNAASLWGAYIQSLKTIHVNQLLMWL